MDEIEIDAYECAMHMLMAGALPVIIPFEDDRLHVIAVRATCRNVLALMINDNQYQRARLAISLIKGIRENHDRQEEEVGP